MKDFRWYTTLETVKDELGITDTTKDAMLSRQIARATDFIEQFTERTFIPVAATKLFDVPVEEPTTRLYLRDELLSVASLSDDSGPLNSLNYRLYPLNSASKTWVQLIGQDSFTYSTSRYGAVAIDGLWGYFGETAETGTVLSTDVSSTASTTITVSSGAAIKTGYSLLIDTEQMFVSGISGSTITVVRGNNGTTATTHLASTQVMRYVVPGVIELAASNLSGFWHLGKESGNIKSKQIGDFRVEYHKGYAVPDFVSKSLEQMRKRL